MKRRRIYALQFTLFLLVFQSIRAEEAPRTRRNEFPVPGASSPQSASQQAHHSPPAIFLRDIWADQKAIWTSPSRIKRRQLFTIVLPLAAATAGLIATDERAARLLPNTPDQVRWSGRVSNAGAVYTLGGLVGGVMIAGWAKHEPEVVKMGRLSAEAFVDSVIVNYAIKGMTARERPDQNNGQGRFWVGGVSFPSGHAMDSWAVATAVARNRECPRWLAITSYSVASIVSLSRWGARKHFPSDILVGGVLGGLIGNYVARRPRP
ncbi:MAG TPA: phosphatase PAP2 family protein [Acidobacteriota bacterium]|nr:phosphatase PAP2 family protein [Acidobacteriota bacterium]